jgi:hypothetical protein
LTIPALDERVDPRPLYRPGERYNRPTGRVAWAGSSAGATVHGVDEIVRIEALE